MLDSFYNNIGYSLKYGGVPSKFWLFFTYIRVFFTLYVASETYSNEYNFICDTNSNSPGCQNQCYMHFAPISLATFWFISLMTAIFPFVMFNMLVEWIETKNKYNAQRDKPQTWISQTKIKRVGTPKEAIWNPVIASALIIKLLLVVAVEGLIIYYFEQLQCAKFNIKQKDCHVGLVLGQVQFLTIPEGYRCYVSQFNERTFFGMNRTSGGLTHLCHGTASWTTCWIPDAIQKTFVNFALFVLTFLSFVSIFCEFFYQIVKRLLQMANKSARCSTLNNNDEVTASNFQPANDFDLYRDDNREDPLYTLS